MDYKKDWTFLQTYPPRMVTEPSHETDWADIVESFIILIASPLSIKV
jgi:hypothetical protein